MLWDVNDDDLQRCFDILKKKLAKNADGLTWLTYRGHEAAFRLAFKLGRQQVEELLDIGVDVNHRNVHVNGGRTVLYTACEQGLVDIAELLLSRGARTKFGVIRLLGRNIQWTPMFIAARNGHHQCVKFLLDHGVGVNDRMTD